MKAFLVFLVCVVAVSCKPATSDDDVIGSVVGVVKSCADEDPWMCIKVCYNCVVLWCPWSLDYNLFYFLSVTFILVLIIFDLIKITPIIIATYLGRVAILIGNVLWGILCYFPFRNYKKSRKFHLFNTTPIIWINAFCGLNCDCTNKLFNCNYKLQFMFFLIIS